MAMSYLQRHPKSGVWRVRISVPPKLRELIGKRELIESLSTKDHAEAKRLAPAVLARFQERISRAERGELFWLDHDIEIVAQEFDSRHFHHGDGPVFETEREFDRALTEFGQERGIGKRDLDDLREEVLSDGWWFPEPQKPARKPQQPVQTAQPVPASSGPDILLSDFKTRFLEGKKINDQYRNELTRTFDLLIRLVGDIPMRQVTRDHIREYRDILLKYPVGRGDGPKADKMNIRDVPNHEWKRTLSPRTVAGYLGYIGMGFKWAISEGYADINPRDSIIIPDQTSTSIQVERMDFQDIHLNRIFTAPLFVGCKKVSNFVMVLRSVKLATNCGVHCIQIKPHRQHRLRPPLRRYRQSGIS